MPLEEQGLDNALAGKEDTIGQEHAEIWIARARCPAGVLQLDLSRETPGYHEEVGVHDRRTNVGDLVYVLLMVAAAGALGVDQRNGNLPGHIQELETHVAPGEGVVVVRRPAARWPAVNGAQR